MVQDLDYAYDTTGNLSSITDQLGKLSQVFSYDAMNRLVTADSTESLYEYGRHTYEYDAAGNIREKGPESTSGAPQFGRLKLAYGREGGGPTGVTAVHAYDGSTWMNDFGDYQYDEAGGVTFKRQLFNNLTLLRNPDGMVHMVSLPAPHQSAAYHYDHTGARAEKFRYGLFMTPLEDKQYIDSTFEVDVLNEKHEVHFFVGGRRVATSKRDGLGNGTLAPVDSIQFYHPDHVGSNTVITSGSGQVLQETYLDPFGATQTMVNGSGQPTATNTVYLFTDQESDAETGLQYFGARYYDPWISRFLSQDPELMRHYRGVTFGRVRRDAQNLNGYSYALNRPTVLTDPTGAFPLDASVAGSQDLAALNSPLGTRSGGCGRDCIPPAAFSNSSFYIENPPLLPPPALGGALGSQGSSGGPDGVTEGTDEPVQIASKGEGNRRDLGLQNVSDEEVQRRARDRSLSPAERRRYQTEEKARRLRPRGGGGGGPRPRVRGIGPAFIIIDILLQTLDEAFPPAEVDCPNCA